MPTEAILRVSCSTGSEPSACQRAQPRSRSSGTAVTRPTRSALVHRRWTPQHDLDGDPRKAHFEQAQSIQTADMMAFHAAEISGRPKRISIVGDTSRIDMEAVSALGTVIKLTADDLIVR